MEKNPNAKVLCTPLHDISFRDLIEKFVKRDNIYICELENYNKIKASKFPRAINSVMV